MGLGFSFVGHHDVTLLAGGEGGERRGTIVALTPACLYVNWHAAASVAEGATTALALCASVSRSWRAAEDMTNTML